MTLRDVIRTRRDGGRHTPEALDLLAREAAAGEAPDYQLAAWLMAAYLHPLDEDETAALTRAMAGSGERLDLSALPGPHLDKHSTGGVGDKTTIALLPLLAACGLTMVKMSGRGLGITGGTIDKLESFPGFRTDLTNEALLDQAGRIGLALSGQTKRLAPADGVLYALRDVTETVDSIPLIAASILSKKLAGGADSVVLDVKCGSGAFMADLAEARELARWLEAIGARCGLRVKATITDMDVPLGRAVGNSLEVQEALAVLDGTAEGSPARRFNDLVLAFAAETLHFAGLVPNEESGRRVAEEAIRSGAARAKVREWFAAQGGAVDPYLNWAEPAPAILEVTVTEPGVVARLDAHIIGEIALALGAGRGNRDDKIDPRVGVELFYSVGDRVRPGFAIARIHAATKDEAEAAERRLNDAVSLSDDAAPRPLFL